MNMGTLSKISGMDWQQLWAIAEKHSSSGEPESLLSARIFLSVVQQQIRALFRGRPTAVHI